MIFLDIETAGLTTEHALLDIGAVEFENPLNQFYEEVRVEKNKKIDLKALEYNQIDKKDVFSPERKSLEKVLKSFEEWVNKIKERNFAGHNPFFDVNFLRVLMKEKKVKRRWSFGYRLVDLYSTAISLYLRRGIKILVNEKTRRYDVDSNFIFNSVGLPDEPKPKKGITGAKMEAETYSRLVFEKGLFPEFEKYSFEEII